VKTHKQIIKQARALNAEGSICGIPFEKSSGTISSLPTKGQVCLNCKKQQSVCTCAKEGKGAKFSEGKLRYDLLPDREIQEIVQVLTDGAKRYAPNNWKQVSDPINVYYAALERHIKAWRLGILKDSDSGRTHLSHAGCCLLFLMWFNNENELSTK